MNYVGSKKPQLRPAVFTALSQPQKPFLGIGGRGAVTANDFVRIMIRWISRASPGQSCSETSDKEHLKASTKSFQDEVLPLFFLSRVKPR